MTKHDLDIVQVLVEKELKAKYKSTSLGFLWSVLQPLLTAVIYYFAFKVIMKIEIENYAFYIISGLFVWQWINVAIMNSMSIYLANRSIVKKIALDRKLLPLSVILSEMVHFIIALTIIILFMFIYSIPFTKNWFFLPIALVMQTIWIYGVAMVVSIANTLFRDIERIVTMIFQILFYASPIIYSVTNIPSEYVKYLKLNPLFPMIEVWHSIFLGTAMNTTYCLLFIVYSLLFFVLGLIINKKYIYNIAEMI